MFQRFSSGIFLFLLTPTLTLGIDKEKKAYELIYKDVQILKQQIQKLDKEISYNSEDIQTIRKQLEELLSLSRLSQKEQARDREEQKKLPGQYQILLEKLDMINTQYARLSEELIELKKISIPSTEQAEEKEEALSAFKLLISKFPLEEETKIAQEKIKELVKANERHQ